MSLTAAAVIATCAPAIVVAQTAAAAPSAQKTPARAATTTPPPRRRRYSATTARARRAQLATARAAARARELRELQTPRFRVDEFGREVPDVRAEAAIIYNPETGEVLWEDHAQDQRSIASITKVMTALVFLESGAPLVDAGHGAAQRRVARVDDLSAHRLQAHRRRPAEPAAGRLRQRRRPRAGARLAVSAPTASSQQDEREGRRARPRATRTTPIRRACSRRTCRRPTTWRG